MGRRLTFAATFLACGVLFAVSGSEAFAHRGHGHPGARVVCRELALGDDCAWEDAEHTQYIGTCRRMSGSLICARNRPLVRADVADPSTEAHADAGISDGALEAGLVVSMLALLGISFWVMRAR